MAGFCELAIGLRAPKLAATGSKSPIVSGRYLKYSRFRETAVGDRVRSGLRGGRGSSMWRLAENTLRKASFLLGTAYYVQTRRNAALLKGSVMVKDAVHHWQILWLRPYPTEKLLSSGDRVAANLRKKDALNDLGRQYRDHLWVMPLEPIDFPMDAIHLGIDCV
jgi:hypothetical protein